MLVAQIKQQIHDRLAIGTVEIACWLIREQDCRARGGRAGKGNALLLSTGHLRGVMPHARAKAYSFQGGFGAGECVVVACKLQRGRDVLKRCHGRDQVKRLEHDPHAVAAKPRKRVLVHRGQVFAHRMHCPARGLLKPAHHHEQR